MDGFNQAFCSSKMHFYNIIYLKKIKQRETEIHNIND